MARGALRVFMLVAAFVLVGAGETPPSTWALDSAGGAASTPATSVASARSRPTLAEADCEAKARRLARLVEQLEEELAAAQSGDGTPDLPGTKPFYTHAFLAFACVVMAALAAGLTMGLVSIEPMEMKIIVNTEDKDIPAEQDKLKLKGDQAAARKVLPLISDHHRLLVTLLLMNSLANEALPLFLDRIVPSWLAVILSVTLVLMFGEIIPSAIFTGSNQLKIAAACSPLVAFFKCLLTPIALPIARVLDRLLGEDHKGRYNFAELRAIVGIHADLRHNGAPTVIFKSHDDMELGIITTAEPHNFNDETVITFTDAPGHPAVSTKLVANSKFYYVAPCDPLSGRDRSCTFKLHQTDARDAQDLVTFKQGELSSGAFMVQERDEIKIMRGVMKLTHMTAGDGVTPLSQACMLERRMPLSRESLARILERGHSRWPVYSQNMHNIRGFILVKKLIVVSPEEGLTVEDMEVQPLVLVSPDILMLDLLNKFQASRCHMALVTGQPDIVQRAWSTGEEIPPDVHMIGIITLEDVIEKLIQEDIFDEHDMDGKPRGIGHSPRKMIPDVSMGSAMMQAQKSLRVSRAASRAFDSKAWGALGEPLLPGIGPAGAGP